MMGVTTTTIHKTRAVGASGPRGLGQILADHFILYFPGILLNDTGPGWPGVLSRLNTPLTFWTCFITLGK